MTSHDVVNRLRKITGEKSVGHLGTLDPMATGVLAVAVGQIHSAGAVFSCGGKKLYWSDSVWICTDTYDAEGEPAGPDVGSEFGAVADARSVIQQAVRRGFHGEMDQLPPPFSAKKIEGTPAYKLAREGKPVELKTAKVRIASLEVVALEGAEAVFAMRISAGGYVRSVAHELGQILGCGAHLSKLRRTQAGGFCIEQARTLEEMQAAAGNVEAIGGTLHTSARPCCRRCRQ